MNNLYEVDAWLDWLIENNITPDGEIDEAIVSQIEVGEEKRIELIDKLVESIRECASRAEARKEEIARLKALIDNDDDKIDRLKRAISVSMQRHSEERLDTIHAKLSLRKSTKVVPDETIWTQPALLEASENEWMSIISVKTTAAFDKRAIMDLHKAGEPIPEGVQIVQERNLQIK